MPTINYYITPPSFPFSVGGLFILCFDLHNLK
uniref:Uncharacterized protein n=1 Tax=Siphoviridae sp. ctfza2 TaxID=2825599 RepID=A0A8S5UY48_9CAUD|nr:MAG TPA: hypothetical protein [Siphoviridae sp. ctfza2]